MSDAIASTIYTPAQMRDIAADFADKGDRYGFAYWSALSHGDTVDEAVAAGMAASAS